MSVNPTSMDRSFGPQRSMLEVQTTLARNMSGADNSLNCPRAFEPLPDHRSVLLTSFHMPIPELFHSKYADYDAARSRVMYEGIKKLLGREGMTDKELIALHRLCGMGSIADKLMGAAAASMLGRISSKSDLGAQVRELLYEVSLRDKKDPTKFKVFRDGVESSDSENRKAQKLLQNIVLEVDKSVSYGGNDAIDGRQLSAEAFDSKILMPMVDMVAWDTHKNLLAGESTLAVTRRGGVALSEGNFGQYVMDALKKTELLISVTAPATQPVAEVVTPPVSRHEHFCHSCCGARNVASPASSREERFVNELRDRQDRPSNFSVNVYLNDSGIRSDSSGYESSNESRDGTNPAVSRNGASQTRTGTRDTGTGDDDTASASRNGADRPSIIADGNNGEGITDSTVITRVGADRPSMLVGDDDDNGGSDTPSTSRNGPGNGNYLMTGLVPPGDTNGGRTPRQQPEVQHFDGRSGGGAAKRVSGNIGDTTWTSRNGADRPSIIADGNKGEGITDTTVTTRVGADRPSMLIGDSNGNGNGNGNGGSDTPSTSRNGPGNGNYLMTGLVPPGDTNGGRTPRQQPEVQHFDGRNGGGAAKRVSGNIGDTTWTSRDGADRSSIIADGNKGEGITDTTVTTRVGADRPSMLIGDSNGNGNGGSDTPSTSRNGPGNGNYLMTGLVPPGDTNGGRTPRQQPEVQHFDGRNGGGAAKRVSGNIGDTTWTSRNGADRSSIIADGNKGEGITDTTVTTRVGAGRPSMLVGDDDDNGGSDTPSTSRNGPGNGNYLMTGLVPPGDTNGGRTPRQQPEVQHFDGRNGGGAAKRVSGNIGDTTWTSRNGADRSSIIADGNKGEGITDTTVTTRVGADRPSMLVGDDDDNGGSDTPSTSRNGPGNGNYLMTGLVPPGDTNGGRTPRQQPEVQHFDGRNGGGAAKRVSGNIGDTTWTSRDGADRSSIIADGNKGEGITDTTVTTRVGADRPSMLIGDSNDNGNYLVTGLVPPGDTNGGRTPGQQPEVQHFDGRNGGGAAKRVSGNIGDTTWTSRNGADRPSIVADGNKGEGITDTTVTTRVGADRPSMLVGDDDDNGGSDTPSTSRNGPGNGNYLMTGLVPPGDTNGGRTPRQQPEVQHFDGRNGDRAARQGSSINGSQDPIARQDERGAPLRSRPSNGDYLWTGMTPPRDTNGGRTPVNPPSVSHFNDLPEDSIAPTVTAATVSAGSLRSVRKPAASYGTWGGSGSHQRAPQIAARDPNVTEPVEVTRVPTRPASSGTTDRLIWSGVSELGHNSGFSPRKPSRVQHFNGPMPDYRTDG